jgi:SAM-dependent methyltransferase
MLVCPFCGGGLAPDDARPPGAPKGWGILTCHCARYPVVAGIPIIKQREPGADRAAALIEAGRTDEALISLLTPWIVGEAPRGAWARLLPGAGVVLWQALARRRLRRRCRARALALVRAPAGTVTCLDMLDFFFRYPGSPRADAYNYFAYRFAQPRHLVALSMASIIGDAPGPILDLACGFGHITRSLRAPGGSAAVVGVDRNFFALYVAKHWVAPEASYVCCEADTALPFPDGAFSAVFCSDSLHTFTNKLGSVRELGRLIGTHGVMMLVTLANSRSSRRAYGRPLPPEAYERLVADLPHSIVTDEEILRRYLRRQGPALARSSSPEALAEAPLLSLVASHRREVFRDYGRFPDWPHAHGPLALNLLYEEAGSDGPGRVKLVRTFPPGAYEEEHPECREYLPEVASISEALLENLEAGRGTPELEKLIAQFVVLGMPERYAPARDAGLTGSGPASRRGRSAR